MNHNVYIYIIVMAVVTYAIRALPLTLIRKEIKNNFIKSFLFYVPFVTLSVMTFPAILHATSNIWSALTGFIVAVILAYNNQGLFKVAAGSCITVFILELII